jgi:GT2 family glycosyltransferase
MTSVKVSVIIAYNKDRGWLNEAIQSVRDQKAPDWIEIELIEVFNPSGNASQNLNEGIKMSTGDFVKYLDEDDKLTPNCIMSSVLAFEPRTDFIHGMSWILTSSTRTPFRPKYTNPTIEQLLRPDWFIHGGTLMYRREVFDKVGLFDETLTCGEELDLNLRCLAAGLKIGWCNKFVYEYRRHDHQKSLGISVNQAEREKIKQQIRNKYL